MGSERNRNHELIIPNKNLTCFGTASIVIMLKVSLVSVAQSALKRFHVLLLAAFIIYTALVAKNIK